MVANKGICDYRTIFITDWAYNVVDMSLLKISVVEESAF
jgi:hypothetical protein